MIHHVANSHNFSYFCPRSFQCFRCLLNESATTAVHADRRNEHLISSILATQGLPEKKKKLARTSAAPAACACRSRSIAALRSRYQLAEECAREAADGMIVCREGLTATHFNEGSSVSVNQITAHTFNKCKVTTSGSAVTWFITPWQCKKVVGSSAWLRCRHAPTCSKASVLREQQQAALDQAWTARSYCR